MCGNIRSTQDSENFVDRTKRKSRRRSEKVSRMGGRESKATVLECRIKSLKKRFGGDYGVKMMPNRLRIFCEVEWPPVGVGWPPENTMNLQIVEAVYTVVTGEPRHLDQNPHIDSWLGLAQDPPTWTRFCIQKGKVKVLMAQKLTDDKKGNSAGFGRGQPDPSPTVDNDAPASQCSTRTGGRLNAGSKAR